MFNFLSRLLRYPRGQKPKAARLKEAKVKLAEKNTRKDSPASIDTIASTQKNKPNQVRPAPLKLEVEPTSEDDKVISVGETSPPVAKPLANDIAAGVASLVTITPENEVAVKAEDLFTKPAPIPVENKANPVELAKVLGNEKKIEAKTPDKNDSLTSIFAKQEEEEVSGIKELLASMAEVKMPEILNEVGAVKELMADLSQQDWVKAARGETGTLVASKGGKDDGKRTKKISQ
jgi:hypothetical protein